VYGEAVTRPPALPARAAAAFDRFPAAVRRRLLAVRALIFRVAARTEGVGRIEETLKWGQPAYVTAASRSGTTIRLGRASSDDDDRRGALFVHCQSSVISKVRALYADTFIYEGERALVLAADRAPPRAALAHAIEIALTYHLHDRRP